MLAAGEGPRLKIQAALELRHNLEIDPCQPLMLDAQHLAGTTRDVDHTPLPE
jgi:hypothetical protein